MRMRLHAVTMTANKQRDNPNIQVNVYKATIEFTIESGTFDLPHLTSNFFAQSKQQENSVIIEAINGNQVSNCSNISKEKKCLTRHLKPKLKRKGIKMLSWYTLSSAAKEPGPN